MPCFLPFPPFLPLALLLSITLHFDSSFCPSFLPSFVAMSNPAPSWPELESSSSTAPQWTLRSESELHVERLEAKLASVQKRARPSKKSHHATLDTLPPELLEPDADDIQEGQEEADEGLWLLWNNKPASSPASRSVPEEETAPDELEARLDLAKANARHVNEYMYNKKERSCHSRICCCLIS